MPTPREFLLRVLPWPGDDTPGFINAHAQCHIDGKTPWTGWPTRDVDSFLQAVYKALQWRTPPDLYMCLSRQSHTRPDDKGNERAAKSQENALALRSIFLDLDVKEGAFGSAGEAIEALTVFRAKFNIPPPTALVASGGGLHVYWISDRDLTPDEWLPYASGLKTAAMQTFVNKCDFGVIADCARVLRIPGTFNYKISGHPRPVRILHLGATDYDFATALSHLPALAGILPVPKVSPSAITGRPDPAFASLPVESLGAGIITELPPLDPVPIIKNCPHFIEALTTSGRDFKQGLWNLTTLAATFMENGNALAHKFAKGYPGYTVAETDALWHRKMAERRDRGIGWPSCKAIQTEGCRHCASCPILARNQSPLHFGRVSRTQRQVQPAPTVATTQLSGNVVTIASGATRSQLTPLTDADLPTDHVIKNGIVHRVISKRQSGGPPNVEYLQLFDCELFKPWAKSNPDALCFITSVDKGYYRDVVVPKASFYLSTEINKHLYLQGVTLYSPNKQHVEHFIVSWLAKLNRAAAAHICAPFGWVMKGNICEGFSYGSVLYRHDGTTGPAGSMDKQIKEMYGPQGELQPWCDAFQMILDQDRPGLETIIAAAFGSPLMVGSGEYVGMFSCWGDTSAFKSTAMRIALAVWGNPKLAKENENATINSVMNRLGQIVNLPYMWDEIKDEKSQYKAYTLLYNSGGKEKSRLFSDVTQRPPGVWENIIGIAANKSFADYVVSQNPDTEAGLVRLFEWKEVKPSRGSKGVLASASDVGRMLRALDTNYGEMGKLWSTFLGANYDLCMQRMKDNSHWFEQWSQTEERFWVAFCAAVLSGAELANEHLGLNFNVVTLRRFLLEKLLEQRKGKGEDAVEGGSYEWTEDRLTWFLESHLRGTIRTNASVPRKPGMVTPIELISYPEKGFPVDVHWSMQTNELIISQSSITAWLRSPTVKSEPRLMKQSLIKHFNMVPTRGKLALGAANFQTGRQPIYVIPVHPNTPLWETMHRIVAPTPVTAPVTGVSNGQTNQIQANQTQANQIQAPPQEIEPKIPSSDLAHQ